MLRRFYPAVFAVALFMPACDSSDDGMGELAAGSSDGSSKADGFGQGADAHGRQAMATMTWVGLDRLQAGPQSLDPEGDDWILEVDQLARAGEQDINCADLHATDVTPKSTTDYIPLARTQQGDFKATVRGGGDCDWESVSATLRVWPPDAPSDVESNDEQILAAHLIDMVFIADEQASAAATIRCGVRPVDPSVAELFPGKDEAFQCSTARLPLNTQQQLTVTVEVDP